jgi:hypothetical protein
LNAPAVPAHRDRGRRLRGFMHGGLPPERRPSSDPPPSRSTICRRWTSRTASRSVCEALAVGRWLRLRP